MTCKCGSTRMMSVCGKSRDLNGIQIPHLNIDHDGYVPDGLGIGDGDYIEFTVCLDCGQIQGWKPVTDEAIKTSMNVKSEVDEEDEAQVSQYPTLDETMETHFIPQPTTVRYTHNNREYELDYKGIMFHRDRAVMLLEDAFGKGWRGNKEAHDILRNSVQAPPAIDIGAAAHMILREILP